MQVRSRNATRISDQTNHLSALHCITGRDERLAQMEIRGDDSAPVIDVDDVSREKEIVDERNHTAIRSAHRFADRAPKINAEVTRGERAIEEASGAEFTCHHRCARLEK